MKTIIAGGRDVFLKKSDYATLDAHHKEHPITQFVCGMAPGVDTCAHAWATIRGIDIHPMPADWGRLGRAAGPIRNRKMAEYAEALVVFDGNKGTRDMVEQAGLLGLRIFDYRTNHEKRTI